MILENLQKGDVQLRIIGSDDFPLVAKGLTDPEVTRFYGISYPDAESAQAQMHWYEGNHDNKSGEFRVIEHQGKTAGVIGLYHVHAAFKSAELGIWLLKEFQGKGIGKTAIQLMVQHGFTYWQLHRIEALVEHGNTASSQVMKACGLELEGIRRDCENKNGQWISMETWAILNTGD